MDFKTIIDMVRNEKYVGDALFQKYYTDDNFNRRRNKGECNQYFATNHHDPIVSRETFEAAQAVIDQHCKEYGLEKTTASIKTDTHFQSKLSATSAEGCSSAGPTQPAGTGLRGAAPHISWISKNAQ